jgi:hypothetical protein
MKKIGFLVHILTQKPGLFNLGATDRVSLKNPGFSNDKYIHKLGF